MQKRIAVRDRTANGTRATRYQGNRCTVSQESAFVCRGRIGSARFRREIHRLSRRGVLVFGSRSGQPFP